MINHSVPFSWQQPLWDIIYKRLSQKKLPHAFMLHAQPGLGLEAFAYRLVQFILCDHKNSMPCGTCTSCHLLESSQHPDFKSLGFDKESMLITVDEVRALNTFTHLKPEGEYKVVLLAADFLNRSASNALLKMLEEPVSRVIFILTTQNPHLLAPTILSRCLKMNMPYPTADQSRAWLIEKGVAEDKIAHLLKLSSNAPLLAYTFDMPEILNKREGVLQDLITLTKDTANPLEIAEKWSKDSSTDTLYLVYGLLANALSSLSQQENAFEEQDEMTGYFAKLGIAPLFELLDNWHQAFRDLKTPGTKAQYVLTAMLIRWQAALKMVNHSV